MEALAIFVEIGPLVTGLLVAGRVGSGIGAVPSNMRATEQIDAIESLSVDSFKFLVVPRIVACTLALRLLTLFLLLGSWGSSPSTPIWSAPPFHTRACRTAIETADAVRTKNNWAGGLVQLL